MPTLTHSNASDTARPQPPAPAKRSRQRAIPRTPSEPLSATELAALLRSARPGTTPPCWGRAAPSPLYWRRLTIYALTGDGVHRVDSGAGAPVRVLPVDLRVFARPALESADDATELVYVADFGPHGDPHREEHGRLAGSDAGCMVDAVHRHCLARGFAAVVRPRVDRHRLATALGLRAGQSIVLVQSVGPGRRTAA